MNEFIREKRESLNLSREELVKDICSTSTLYRYETGKIDISSEIFIKLLNKLRISKIDITRSNLNYKESHFLDILLDSIYHNDYLNIEHLINNYSYDPEINSYSFYKIFNWAKAIISCEKANFSAAKFYILQINPKIRIDNYLDIHILNTLSLIYIHEKNIKKAHELLNKIVNNTFFIHNTDYKAKIKINYNFAYINYHQNNKIIAFNILNELLYFNKINNSNFMQGKILHFLYIINKDFKELEVAKECLKKAYCAFFIEDNQDKYIHDLLSNDFIEMNLKIPFL